MILSEFAAIGLISLLGLGLALLLLALWRPGSAGTLHPPASAWSRYRFGFVTFSLIFLAFDMEMIFMYPWAVVFAEIGLKAFLDMLVFIALLGGGVAYAWGMGALEWE